MHFRIGTRGSKLARWQANFVENLLQNGGHTTEIVIIETKGDKILDRSLSKIGSKGVFTEELEDQLRNKSIDIAVHSAKDMQSDLHSDFALLAFTEREEVNDVLVSFNKSHSLSAGTPLVVGTSSTRRIAMLKAYYPHIQTVDMRGNLQTRLQKLKEGHCEALILAYAGVHRMEYDDMIAEKISVSTFIPAVGQGSVAIQAMASMPTERQQALRSILNHEATETCLLAERSFLKALQGGCSVPVFALARLNGDLLSIKGGVISLDGQEVIVFEEIGSADTPEEVGYKLAWKVANSGGREVLKKIKEG
jgi:hydroxymethylbilane synthase